MAKEKFVRDKNHPNISGIKVKKEGINIRTVAAILDAGRKKGKELGLDEADFSKYDKIDSSKEE